jgi:Sec7-like guanine-nucleotide exchange factor
MQVVKFNLKPSKTVEAMVASNAIPRTPEAIAKFLRETKGLNKTTMGQFLTKHDAFNRQVM